MNIFKKIYYDIKNYIYFVKTIKRESEDSKSLYNFYNFGHNSKYTRIGCLISLTDECSQIDELHREIYLNEKIVPIARYLDKDLNLAECV